MRCNGCSPCEYTTGKVGVVLPFEITGGKREPKDVRDACLKEELGDSTLGNSRLVACHHGSWT